MFPALVQSVRTSASNPSQEEGTTPWARHFKEEDIP
jgi:hypothetical protein